jgi:protease-4
MSESSMPPSGAVPPQVPRASSAPPAPPWPPPTAAPVSQPSRRAERQQRRPWWRRLLLSVGVLIFLGSVVMNMYLLFMLSLFMEGPLETTVVKPGQRDQVVAVWDVSGTIGQKQAELVGRFCREVQGDPHVKAVVLRVDSPGGAISPCDRIYKSLKDLKSSGKTLVVSMGGVAASGGYYVSAAADEIYAEPTTITGSIGVLGIWPILKGTMEKLGVKMVIVRSTNTKAWKAAPSYFEDPAGYQMDEIQKTIDAAQGRFESVVKAERLGKLADLTPVRKDYTGPDGKKFTVLETEPFNGKIFLADRAKELGLVDQVGYLDDAVDAAGRLARLAKPKVVRYAKRKSIFEGLGLGAGIRSVNVELLDEIQTPRLMMVWKVP